MLTGIYLYYTFFMLTFTHQVLSSPPILAFFICSLWSISAHLLMKASHPAPFVLVFHLQTALSKSFFWPRSLVAAATAAKSLQSCQTLWDHRAVRQQPTKLPCPWDSPGNNTGVGCHFLLQCMKVKSESEVAQSCPTLRNPMDCSLPGTSVHGIFRQDHWSALPLPSLCSLVNNIQMPLTPYRWL